MPIGRNPERLAAALLAMNVSNMRQRTYIFAGIAVTVAVACAVLGVVFAKYRVMFMLMSLGELLFAVLLLTIRLRHLEVIQSFQHYVSEKRERIFESKFMERENEDRSR